LFEVGEVCVVADLPYDLVWSLADSRVVRVVCRGDESNPQPDAPRPRIAGSDTEGERVRSRYR
jgi:hypothetical protein